MIKKTLKLWILPILVSLGLFIAIRPTLAQIAGGDAGLTEFLAANNVEIGDEIGENGFRQIYYVWGGGKNFITDTNYTNGEPDTEGEYITWMGQSAGGGWQIFLYHIPTGITTQLSNSSNNANPKISKGKVVWEGWDTPPDGEAGWQVFLFDGTKILQLTSGDLSINPDIEADFVAYSRKDIGGTYRAVVYSVSKGEAKDVTVGISTKRPKINGNKILLAGEVFPLTIDDLFLLDLVPLTQPTAPETVTTGEIIEELEATPSAIPEASPSGETQ